jgi:hypothetical protein
VDKIAVYFHALEHSLLTDTDNIKHSDLIDADNDNKHTLLDGQVDQTEFCFLWGAHAVRRVIRHKAAALDLLACHYPFLFTFELTCSVL